MNKALNYLKRYIKNSQRYRETIIILLELRAYIEEDLEVNKANIEIYYEGYSF